MAPWIIPLVQMGMSVLQSKNKQAAQNRNNKAQAEITRYSPWTDMKGTMDTSYVPGVAEAGVGGFIGGLGTQQGLERGQLENEYIKKNGGIDWSALDTSKKYSDIS